MCPASKHQAQLHISCLPSPTSGFARCAARWSCSASSSAIVGTGSLLLPLPPLLPAGGGGARPGLGGSQLQLSCSSDAPSMVALMPAAAAAAPLQPGVGCTRATLPGRRCCTYCCCSSASAGRCVPCTPVQMARGGAQRPQQPATACQCVSSSHQPAAGRYCCTAVASAACCLLLLRAAAAAAPASCRCC